MWFWMRRICAKAAILVALTTLSSAAGGAAQQEPKLVQAQILFRHGMRAPTSPYPTDPFQDEAVYWPNGWGELTDYGKEQMYVLGKYLRTRYADFLSTKYNRTEMEVVSTDVDRTLESAALTLAGLYPNGQESWNEFSHSRLDWQPIPIHTISDGQNRLMLHHAYLYEPELCPRFYRHFHEEMVLLPEAVREQEENAELIAMIREQTGMPESGWPWFHVVTSAMGTLAIEQFYNLSIPAWAVDVLANPANLDLFGAAYAHVSGTDEMKRIGGGPLLKEWIGLMKDAASGAGSKKLFMYSAHDLNLATVLNTMGLLKPTRVPEVGSTLFVELYQEQGTGNGTAYIVELHYLDGMTAEIAPLSLPGCPPPCSLDQFEQTLARFLPDDLDEECGVTRAVTSEGARVVPVWLLFLAFLHVFV